MLNLKKDLENDLKLLGQDNAHLRQQLDTKFEEICLYMAKIHEQWSNEYKD